MSAILIVMAIVDGGLSTGIRIETKMGDIYTIQGQHCETPSATVHSDTIEVDEQRGIPVSVEYRM